jgi:3-isopropylmalate dehydrogenase
MPKTIALLRGDGIGPEIIGEAVKTLEAVARRFDRSFAFVEADMGGCAVDRCGDPFPDDSLECCRAADAVLFGAVGGPKWDGLPRPQRPETGLLKMRSSLGLFANLRPARLHPQLAQACPLKQEIIDRGIDILIVRELTGGLYFGTHETFVENGERVARDELVYREHEIDRVLRVAFAAAQKRRGRVTSVEKSNVLDSSRLWREVAHTVAADYPDVELIDMIVDNAAMQLVGCPSQFDVLVTENMFGDILSDEASMVVGSIGMMPSASMGVGPFGVFEPIHGSAPAIAGRDMANPIGTILSAAMMLRYALGMPGEAQAVEAAVSRILDEGYRTPDILSKGCVQIGCAEMGTRIARAV